MDTAVVWLVDVGRLTTDIPLGFDVELSCDIEVP